MSQTGLLGMLSGGSYDDVGSPATENYVRHKALTEGLDYTFYIRPRYIRVFPQRRAASNTRS